MRVAEGGHHVSREKIIERRARSLKQLPWFLAHADGAWIFDNSGSTPRLIATKADDKIEVSGSAMPEIREAARLARTQDVE